MKRENFTVITEEVSKGQKRGLRRKKLISIEKRG